MGAYLSRRRTISEEDLVNLHGKVVVITGGNSGIGYTTIQFLAQKGAKVYMASRNEEKCKEAIERLEKDKIGDGSVEWIKLELADPRRGKEAAQRILEKEDRLDILINNAAKAIGPPSMTSDGLQEMMITNYLTHFVFTEALLPLMVRTSKREGSDVRILNLTSVAHRMVTPTTFVGKESLNIDFGDSAFGRLQIYGLSKIATILHIKHLQRRLEEDGTGIICIAVDPGKVRTENVALWLEDMPYLYRKFSEITWPFIVWPPREGAMNTAYAAASPEVKAKAEMFKGAHLEPVGCITDPSVPARDDRLANELYDTTMDILAGMGL